MALPKTVATQVQVFSRELGIDDPAKKSALSALLTALIKFERERALEEAAALIDEGFDRGIKHKRDTCDHAKFQWEDCEQCASAAIRNLAAASRGE